MRVVIDANNQLHKLYHAMGVDGAAKYWLRMLDVFCRQYVEGNRLSVYVAFDGVNGTAWRRQLEPTYKSGRGEKKADLLALLSGAALAAIEEGYQVFNIDSAEADDVVAALVSRTDDKAIMVSSDKDLHQLLEAGRVNQLRKFKIAYEANGQVRGSVLVEPKWYTQADFEADYRIHPSRWPLWKAIAGDPSDCLSGVPGCGDDLATMFCTKYESVAAITAASMWEWPFKKQNQQGAMANAVRSGSLAKWEQVTTLRRDCLDLVLAEGGA